MSVLFPLDHKQISAFGTCWRQNPLSCNHYPSLKANIPSKMVMVVFGGKDLGQLNNPWMEVVCPNHGLCSKLSLLDPLLQTVGQNFSCCFGGDYFWLQLFINVIKTVINFLRFLQNIIFSPAIHNLDFLPHDHLSCWTYILCVYIYIFYDICYISYILYMLIYVTYVLCNIVGDRN